MWFKHLKVIHNRIVKNRKCGSHVSLQEGASIHSYAVCDYKIIFLARKTIAKNCVS